MSFQIPSPTHNLHLNLTQRCTAFIADNVGNTKHTKVTEYGYTLRLLKATVPDSELNQETTYYEMFPAVLHSNAPTVTHNFGTIFQVM